MAKKKPEVAPVPGIVWPQHKTGKHCGYTLYEDGSIDVAPRYRDQLRALQLERNSLDEFLASITRVAQRMATGIAQSERDVWKAMEEDYGLKSHEKGYMINMYTGHLAIHK